MVELQQTNIPIDALNVVFGVLSGIGQEVRIDGTVSGRLYDVLFDQSSGLILRNISFDHSTKSSPTLSSIEEHLAYRGEVLRFEGPYFSVRDPSKLAATVKGVYQPKDFRMLQNKGRQIQRRYAAPN